MTPPSPGTLADLFRPRRRSASRDYVHQVRTGLAEIGDLRVADVVEQLADYLVNEMERIGGSDARLVFTVDDGTGPYCSWCWTLGGLCPHIAGGASEHVNAEGDQTP